MDDRRWTIHLRCKSDIPVMFSKRNMDVHIIEDLMSMNKCSEPLAIMHGEHRFALSVLSEPGRVYAWEHLIKEWDGWSKGGRSGLEGWHIVVDLPVGHELFVVPTDGEYSRRFSAVDEGTWWFDSKEGWSRG